MAVGNWEYGCRQFTLDRLEQLADVSGVSITYLLGQSRCPKKPCEIFLILNVKFPVSLKKAGNFVCIARGV